MNVEGQRRAAPARRRVQPRRPLDPLAARRRRSSASHAGFADYRFDVVAGALYEFTWNEFCDWYLELSKAVLQSDDPRASAQKRGTRRTLIGTLEMLLRALHPLAPFISEEIWQRVRAAAGVAGETDHACALSGAGAGVEPPDAGGRSPRCAG